MRCWTLSSQVYTCRNKFHRAYDPRLPRWACHNAQVATKKSSMTVRRAARKGGIWLDKTVAGQ